MEAVHSWGHFLHALLHESSTGQPHGHHCRLTLVEMAAGLIQNPADHRKPVAASVKSQLRLVPAFRRQRRHAFAIDIRRIGNDKIVARRFEQREQVATQQPNAFLQAVIGDISPGLQVKLLRVLQDGLFERLGSNTPRKFCGRIICSTNRNLREMVQSDLETQRNSPIAVGSIAR